MSYSTTIPRLIEDATERFSGSDALIDDGVRLTYAELGSRIRDAARALIASGIEHGDRVAIWAPNVWEWVIAGLAVHSVGGVLVPVNTRFKGREAKYVLDRSRAKLLFTVRGFLDTDYPAMLVEADGAPSVEEIVLFRGDTVPGTTSFAEFLTRASQVDEGARSERAAAVTGDDIAHILFTSGTTGAPKGAMLAHRAVCRAYSDWNTRIGLREGDRYLISNPFFHSFGLQAGILSSLMLGCAIIPLTVFDPDAVAELIERERVTMYPGPPSVFLTLIDHPARRRHDLSSLRLVVVGAAAIPVELIRRIRDELGLESVVTGYGLTEATGLVTTCHHGDDSEVIATTAGPPLPGIEVAVVDDTGAVLPTGEPGEILVRGHTVMLGYLDDPEQTAEAIDADGWLHTGDIGLLTGAGNLVITDRKKDLFIVGGFNAYPAEIESLMTAHPAIGQVAVIGVPDDRLGEVGMAFVIQRPDTTVSEDELVDWCRNQMANYKVPRFVRFVAELPLNASGKVLKHELRRIAGGFQ